jgi:multidrug resistance efflux pump
MVRPIKAYLASASSFSSDGRALQQLDWDITVTMKHRVVNFLITMTLVIMACWAAWSLYQKYVQDPWTRDGQVRANVIGIAPRVAGPVIRIAVTDNQQVKAGDLLFEIDPALYQAQLNVAQGETLNANANLKQRQQDLERQTNLFKQRVTAQQDFQNAQDNFAAAEAQVTSAKANLQLAELNLSYTKVFAPKNGYITDLNVSAGTYVSVGTQLMALVDTDSFWIAAYFKETQLAHIQVGQKANLVIMGYGKLPFEGVVRSIGWGIYVQDGSAGTATNLLPAVNQTVDWVRLPQRFPVRIEPLGRPPVSLRIGQTVSASMTSRVENAALPDQKLQTRP